MDLDFVRIECEVTADIPVQLTAALYGALRSFAAHFKAACCPDLLEICTTCRERVRCPFHLLFGQELSSDPETVRLHQKPSLPFSLYVNGIDGNSSLVTVGMSVIGSAVNYIAFFHTALLRVVETGVGTLRPAAKYTLRCYSLDYQGVRQEIKSAVSLPESIILLSGEHILQNTVHSGTITLDLKSPLRLLSSGSIAHRFDFGMFFCSQLRRCSSLCAYYGAGELDLDFAGLSKAAQDVAVLEDKTNYTQPPWSKRPNNAGVTGTAECAGLVEPMHSMLILGSYFNAGKGATFGSGFHQIEVH